jgi:hypothetical protein
MATYAEMPHSQRMPERLHGPFRKNMKRLCLKVGYPSLRQFFYSQNDDSSMDFTLCSDTAVAVSSKHVS